MTWFLFLVGELRSHKPHCMAKKKKKKEKKERREKPHMIILVAEKAFDNSQHNFMIKYSIC